MIELFCSSLHAVNEHAEKPPVAALLKIKKEQEP